MRYHIFTPAEQNEHWERTGRGRDSYANIRPDVDRCIDSDPIWADAKRNGHFLERHGWDMQRSLLHAAMITFIVGFNPYQGGETRDITRAEFMEWLQGQEQWGRLLNPTWTPFDADDLPRCPACNNPLPQYEFGRPAKYCNDACKMKAYRQRRVTKVNEVNHALQGQIR